MAIGGKRAFMLATVRRIRFVLVGFMVLAVGCSASRIGSRPETYDYCVIDEDYGCPVSERNGSGEPGVIQFTTRPDPRATR